MAESVVRCAKCKARMEEGFVLDHGHGGHQYAASWVAGAPERSFWLGVKTRGKPELPVRTFRCTACGYLESYANSPQ